MKFYIGDKVRILDGSKIENYTADWCMDDRVGKIHTIEDMIKFEDGRIGFHTEEDCGIIYDKRGLELVKRGPNAPKRKKKSKKTTTKKRTPKFKVGDLVRVKPELVSGRDYGGLTLWEGGMSDTRGTFGKVETVYMDCDSPVYRIYLKPFYYSEEMLEPVMETSEKHKVGKTIERKELLRSFMKLTETDKSLKELVSGIPLFTPTFMIILEKIERDIFGEVESND